MSNFWNIFKKKETIETSWDKKDSKTVKKQAITGVTLLSEGKLTDKTMEESTKINTTNTT